MTSSAPQKALKSITCDKLSVDERVLDRVGHSSQPNLRQYSAPENVRGRDQITFCNCLDSYHKSSDSGELRYSHGSEKSNLILRSAMQQDSVLTPQVPKPEALPKLIPVWKVTFIFQKTILSFLKS